MPCYIKKLEKGPEVLFVPVKKGQSVTILVLVPVGSRYEKKRYNGAFHFIEHMLFKGTKKRPSNFLIARELDSYGAEYNAFTQKDHTGFWIKINKDKIENALEIMSDILFNSVFEKNAFEKERKVILEEMKMYEDNPLMYIDDFFEETIFGKNHPLGQLIIGKREVIKNIKREELIRLKNNYYLPNKILITIAGNFKLDKCQKLIEKYFFYKSKKLTFEKFKKFKKSKKSKIKILKKDTKQTQLALGYFGYPYGHKNTEVLDILSVILGGNMSSRLFSEIRVKRGLAYYVKTDITSYQDVGIFAVYAGVPKEKTKETIEVILNEVKKIKEKGPTLEEVERAKTYLEGKIKLAIESSSFLASWYGKRYLFTKKIITPQKKIEKIKETSIKEIKKVINEIFNPPIYLSLIGDIKKNKISLPDFNK